jgi:hypothetical protein
MFVIRGWSRLDDNFGVPWIVFFGDFMSP